MVLLCNTDKNVKNVINRFYRGELKTDVVLLYCLTVGEMFDQGNISCNFLHKVCG